MGTRLIAFTMMMYSTRKFILKSFIFSAGFLLSAYTTYAQEAPLLRTDDFLVTKSGAWCAQHAKLTATTTSSRGKLPLNTLASEIKFILEFECPIAQHINVDLVGINGEVKSYVLSQETHWKLVEGTVNQSIDSTETQTSIGSHLSSWRPDAAISVSGDVRCQKSMLARSSYFIKAMNFDQTKRSFYDLAQYSSKLRNSDRGYKASLIQLAAEKEKLSSQIEFDERQRSARGLRMFGIKGKRSDNAKAAIQRLSEIGSDDPALQSIIEISFDRMHAIDNWAIELDTEIAAIPHNAQGFSQAFTAKQSLTELQNCIGWKPEDPTLIKFIPDIIGDHENEFFTSIDNKFDQAARERTPFARDMLLSQIKNIRDAVSLEYFWGTYPDYIQDAYKTDSEISSQYNTRLTILRAEAAKAQEEAEKKAKEEEKERLSKEYNSEFLYVALPPKTLPVPTPFLSPAEQVLIEQHEEAQLNSVGHATRLSPEICTTTRSRILYGGWAPGAATESTSCSPQVNIGKEKQRKLLASKGPSFNKLYSVCAEQLIPEFCECLSKRNEGHFTAEEYSLFSKSPRAYISFINERKFMRYTLGLSSSTHLNGSDSISDFMESGAINALAEAGAERMGNIFTGLAALMQGHTESAVNQFRKAQLMVPSNAGDLTTFCIATTR